MRKVFAAVAASMTLAVAACSDGWIAPDDKIVYRMVECRPVGKNASIAISARVQNFHNKTVRVRGEIDVTAKTGTGYTRKFEEKFEFMLPAGKSQVSAKLIPPYGNGRSEVWRIAVCDLDDMEYKFIEGA